MARETRIINKFGVMTGWNSITANVMGRDLEGISALAYSDSETKENVYGSGKYPVGRSRGNYEPTASFTLYKEEVDALKNPYLLVKGYRISLLLISMSVCTGRRHNHTRCHPQCRIYK